MRAERVWYVVMNSNRARILKDLPRERAPAPPEVTIEGAGRKMRDVLRDQPTRSFAAAGGGRRSSVEPGTDPLREDARHFLRDITDYLMREQRKRAFDRLVIVAPDDMLGLWRAEASQALKDCVQQEFNRNLAGFSADHLGEAIRGLMAA